MSDEVIIQFKNVGVYYRGGQKRDRRHGEIRWALRGLNLEVRRGEKLAIIGRNGAGKSTLLRLLAGIIDPDEGEVNILHHDLHVQLLSLGVGFEGHLSGAENAILSGLFMGKSRRYMESRLIAIQEFSELGAAFLQPVNTYSTGMNARLGFSIALQTNPEVFLIDEVLGVGDQSFLMKSETAIRQKFGIDTTVILISHDASLVRQICNRVIWLHLGSACMDGPAADVLTAYAKG